MYKFENLIEEVKELNTELKYGLDDIVGVTIEKGLIPTVANLTQTALDKFYIVKPETFIYNPRTHGVRLGMGYNETSDTYITSWNNVAFRVKGTAQNIVLPQYLWLYFCRPIWDRITNFLAWGSSTIVFAWKDFLNIDIELPSIDKQREIVEEYETLSRRIRLNEQMIEKLEATAQALYRKMFVDGIDKENLPEGWSVKTLGEVCKNITDGVHNTVDDDINGDYLLLSCKNIKGGRISIGENERRIDFETFKKLRKRTQLKKGDILISSVGTIGELVLLNEEPTNYEFQRSVAIIRADKDIVSPSFLFFSLKSQKDMIEQTAHGAVQRCLFISDIANLKTIYPPSPDIIRFTELTLPLLNYIHIRHCENSKLSELQSLLLAKMGNLKQ